MAGAEKQIGEALAGFGKQVGALAGSLRLELKRETQPAFELAGYSARSFNIGYGFTTTSWDCFCAVCLEDRSVVGTAVATVMKRGKAGG